MDAIVWPELHWSQWPPDFMLRHLHDVVTSIYQFKNEGRTEGTIYLLVYGEDGFLARLDLHEHLACHCTDDIQALNIPCWRRHRKERAMQLSLTPQPL